MMEVHHPRLQWKMETYRLEGSLQHHTVTEDHQLLSTIQYYEGKPEHAVNRRPSNALLLRKRALSQSRTLSGSELFPVSSLSDSLP